MISADLHMHSAYSLDGELLPLEILQISKQQGLSVISITDHNLVSGVPEALEASGAYGIRVIPGIEIDCNYKGTDLHVLGYHINHLSKDFVTLEKQIAEGIMNAFDAMAKNLHRLGIPVDADEVIAEAHGKLPSGELIAEVLLNHVKYNNIADLDPYRPGGSRSDMPMLNFYLDFFAQGKPAYVKIDYMDYTEAIDLIKRNGGISVIAHPGHNFRGREEAVADLIKLGAEGIEVFNNYHSPEQMRNLAEMAIGHNVLITCGSDFHGKTKPVIGVGQYGMLDEYEGYLQDSLNRLL
jgi:predicted metal-dependent phosphoesterase TrpH